MENDSTIFTIVYKSTIYTFVVLFEYALSLYEFIKKF